MKKLLKAPRFYFLLLILFCILLWLVRIYLTKSLFFGFLIWNLFLAYVPFHISTILKIKTHNLSKVRLILGLIIWLLFLPNAPYIITDFIHLHHSESNLVWFDIFILFVYASTGLLFAITSLTQINKIIIEKWNSKFANYFSIVATFLCGFGIYLGRFLRFNSWDAFTSPLNLIKQSILSINDPKTWFITISFGSFLYLLLLIFKRINISWQ